MAGLKLNLGCGYNVLNGGWINTDKERTRDRVKILDVTFEFPYPDFSCGFIFSEHLFEHLTEKEGRFMLSEVYRVLEPGGVLRLALPTREFLEKIKNEPEKYQDYIDFHFDTYDPQEKIRSAEKLAENFKTMWGHKMIYSIPELYRLLEDSGFKNIYECEIYKSIHPELRRLEHHGRKEIPEKFNILETAILEAIK